MDRNFWYVIVIVSLQRLSPSYTGFEASVGGTCAWATCRRSITSLISAVFPAQENIDVCDVTDRSKECSLHTDKHNYWERSELSKGVEPSNKQGQISVSIKTVNFGCRRYCTPSVKDRALEVLGTLQGNEEEGPMMGEYIGLINDRGYDTLAN